MTHDPMCPFKDMGELNFVADDSNNCWGCRLITEVRQEERNRSDLYMQGYADGREDKSDISTSSGSTYEDALRDAVSIIENTKIFTSHHSDQIFLESMKKRMIELILELSAGTDK